MNKLLKRHIYFIICNVVMILYFCLPTYSQKKQTRQQPNNFVSCSLELENAPVIHGAKLGMTLNEFRKVFPAAVVLAKLRNGTVSYEMDIVDDVAIDVAWFLDSKLVFVGFNYRESSVTNIVNFRRQTARKLGLPITSWKNEELKCKGFRVIIDYPSYKAGGSGPPYLQLEDISGYSELMVR